MTIEINRMARVILTVSRFEIVREFYRKLLPEFGMRPVDAKFRCVWGRSSNNLQPWPEYDAVAGLSAQQLERVRLAQRDARH